MNPPGLSRRRNIKALVGVVVLVLSACAPYAEGSTVLISQESIGGPVTSEPISARDVRVRSIDRVEFDWGLLITAPNLAGVEFIDYDSRFSQFRTQSGEYIVLGIDFDDRRKATGISVVRKGPTASSIGGTTVKPLSGAEAAVPPLIPGYRFVDSQRLYFRALSYRFVGVWRSNQGDESRIVAFDNPGYSVEGRPNYRALATVPLEVSVISTNGSHDGGPTLITVATSPTSAGTFRLVNLQWPAER